jgi:hypothetical protein
VTITCFHFFMVFSTFKPFMHKTLRIQISYGQFANS